MLSPRSTRRPVPVASLLLLAVAWISAGCGDPTPPSDGGRDAQPRDAQLDDVSIPDGGTVDTGTPDGGTLDGSAPDAHGDAGLPDAELAPDGAAIDAAPDGGRTAPVFRNPVDLADGPLATEALRILGLGTAGESCAECHGITRARIRAWRTLSDVALEACLTDLDVGTAASAQSMIACLRDAETGTFHPSRAGVFSTAARLEWFPYVFERAIGAGWEVEHDDFVERTGMPPEPRDSLTQAEFDIVAEWFIRGVPELEAHVPAEPPPTDCTPHVDAAVATHVAAMAISGWRAANEDDGILMFGCAGATRPEECLTSEPLASSTSFGAGWDVIPGARARVLYTTAYASSFWTRSSADGRFVGHGGGSAAGSTIIDLQSDRTIAVRASYDPAFFPDNSGFMMLGGGGVCEQSVLTTGTPTVITFGEPQCGSADMVGLYEHVGASLGGEDYWAVHGEFVSDNGGHVATPDNPPTGFSSFSVASLTRMLNTGSGFESDVTLTAPTPSEGDTVISPSSRLLVSRFGTGFEQSAFVLRRLTATRVGTEWDVEAPEIARYCAIGGKPAFSYDERWLVYHRYIGSRDEDAIELGYPSAAAPGFAEYRTRGAANVYLIDLVTGETTLITHMRPGQYALFPHFRSDGWIYFLVRIPGTSGEHVVATDAALILAGD
jgi:hypothetical protein